MKELLEKGNERNKMSIKYIDLLNKYLKLNNKKSIGYNEDEIIKIEKLYNIEIKSDFREFLKIAGRSSGGLLEDNIISIYTESRLGTCYVVGEYFTFHDEDEIELYNERYNKPFSFAYINERHNYFMRTIDEDLMVYHYDDEISKLECTNMNFNQFMLKLVQDYNPKLEPLSNITSLGNLLPEEDLESGKEIEIKEISEYVKNKKKTEKDFIYILEKYLRLNNKKSIGYSEKEIEAIENYYYLNIKKDFKDFLKFAGRSSGGLLGENQLLIYKNWTVRENLLFQSFFSEYYFEPGEFLGMCFLLSIENNNEYYFIKTKEEDLKVYCYNKKNNTKKETELNFNEYILDLIKNYNSELKPLENKSIKGELIKITV